MKSIFSFQPQELPSHFLLYFRKDLILGLTNNGREVEIPGVPKVLHWTEDIQNLILCFLGYVEAKEYG